MNRGLKLFILLAWVGLFAMLLQRDYFVETLDIHEAQVIQQARELSFLGVYFQGERIGYVKYRLTPSAEDGFHLDQEAFLLLNILNEKHPVTMQLAAGLSREHLLRDFTFSLSSPFYGMEAEGQVAGNQVRFTMDTGKEKISDSIRLTRPPFLAINQRAYLLQKKLQPGDKIKIPYFDPVTLAGKDTILEYRGLEKVLIKNRVYRLHHFIESFSGVRINSWLDEEGKVIKEESPAGFVFLNEPEFQATAISGSGSEILRAVAVPVSGRMPELSGRQVMRYRLTLPEEGDFSLTGGRQQLNDDILTLNREALPPVAATACQNSQGELAASPFIQADNPRIKDQAHAITKGLTNDLARMQALAAWVYDNLEKRPVIGIPDALTTLTNLRGDCNEHAVLFAALARSLGIPTRVAAGVMYHEGVFFYHAWNEVCLGSSWLSLDTTRNQLPADLSHIRFVHGESQEMVRIGALLGNLQIEILNQPASEDKP